MKYLVVVDMQNDFVDGALGTKEAVAIVEHVVEKIKQFDGPIFVTLDTHTENYMNTREGKHLPVPHCIKGSDGWNLNKKVQNALTSKNYIVVEKPTFGCVKLPELIQESAGKEEFTIELIGLCTDICVVSNAILLKTHYPEKEIIVDATCCAGVTVQSHKEALNTMKMCQITVIGE